jgi:hypothetical protein
MCDTERNSLWCHIVDHLGRRTLVVAVCGCEVFFSGFAGLVKSDSDLYSINTGICGTNSGKSRSRTSNCYTWSVFERVVGVKAASPFAASAPIAWRYWIPRCCGVEAGSSPSKASYTTLYCDVLTCLHDALVLL